MSELTRVKSTLEQWRILQAVVDHGGYSKAAAALNKSQSSLNHAVSKLQQQMGVALLEVQGRKAYLTPAGEVMLRRSRVLTQSAIELEQLAANLGQGWEPEITIAVEVIYPKAKLYDALAEFLPASRGSRIQILDTVITGTKDAITQKTADIVITGLLPKGVLGQPLTAVNLLPCVGQRHPLSQQEQVNVDELAQATQIVIKDTSQSPDESTGWLKSEHRWTVSNFHEAKALLARGIGFCWLPEHLVETELASGDVVALALQQGNSRRTFTHLVLPDEHHIGPGAKALAKHIIAQHSDLCPPVETKLNDTE